MQEYHKIDTIYLRGIEGSKKLIEGAYRSPTVEFLKDLPWVWTEKIDGTNIRVHWDGHRVEYGGRTDKAQIPMPLINKLVEYFGGEENAQIFEQNFGDNDVIIFGEGYGAKIQNGGSYTVDGKSVDFIVFDVMINGNYQERVNVAGIAIMFGLKIVPIVDIGTLDDAVAFVKGHPNSKLAFGDHEMEGLVCRPKVELLDRCGNRLIVKIKYRDFK